jgi:hypothetical protein
VGGVSLEMLVDSGATSNIVDEATLEHLKSGKIVCASKINKSEKILYTYASKQPLQVKGSFTCTIQAGDRQTKVEFTVIHGKGVPLLGNTTAT